MSRVGEDRAMEIGVWLSWLDEDLEAQFDLGKHVRKIVPQDKRGKKIANGWSKKGGGKGTTDRGLKAREGGKFKALMF